MPKHEIAIELFFPFEGVVCLIWKSNNFNRLICSSMRKMTHNLILYILFNTVDIAHPISLSFTELTIEIIRLTHKYLKAITQFTRRTNMNFMRMLYHRPKAPSGSTQLGFIVLIFNYFFLLFS